GAIKLHGVRAIGALQRAAMRDLGQHGKRNAEALGLRPLLFQYVQRVVVAHDVFSRASVKKPLSARSCSIAITSVAIISRGAAYFQARGSILPRPPRAPSQSCRTSTATSPGASPRSGARIAQTFRVSSNFSFVCRGSTGRLVSTTLM